MLLYAIALDTLPQNMLLYAIALDTLPQNITRCKAYGIPNSQNKACKNVKRFLDHPDDDCHKSKHVALMLYFKC